MATHSSMVQAWMERHGKRPFTLLHSSSVAWVLSDAPHPCNPWAVPSGFGSVLMGMAESTFGETVWLPTDRDAIAALEAALDATGWATPPPACYAVPSEAV